MVDFLMNGLVIAGVISIFTMPVAVWALIGQGATCRRLEQRNAAQAQTIAQMQRRLSGVDVEDERRARFEAECG